MAEGVADHFVRSIYRVAKHAHARTEDPAIKVALDSLMTAIADAKPTVHTFGAFDVALLQSWHHALLACDAAVEPDALALLGPAQAFLEDVLSVKEPWQPCVVVETAVPGLRIACDAIAPAEEAALLREIEAGAWDATSLRRRVQHYGFRYDYASPRLSPAPPLPAWALGLYDTCVEVGLGCPAPPQQVIVNEYEPGAGIGAHTDHEKLFGDYVLAVSLGSGCVMEFRHKATGSVVSEYMPRRSAYMMEREARYDWTHGIAARRSDKVDGKTVLRKTRMSVTFRAVRK